MECDQEPMFPCSFCLYKAKRKHHLKKHMIAKHSEHMDAMESDQCVWKDNTLCTEMIKAK